MARVVHGLLPAVVAVLAVSLAESAAGQEAKSAALAKQLTAALDEAKLDSLAAKDPSAPDVFVGVLYFQGSPLLVVSAKYAVPQLLNDRLTKKEYRDIYIDLNSASIPETKVFIQDAAGDGLKSKRDESTAPDTYEKGAKQVVFDGDWKRQKMTEQEYMKAFSTADEEYSHILSALLAQLKKTS
jgi:hypothetical protein